jgi:hypothetical protein
MTILTRRRLWTSTPNVVEPPPPPPPGGGWFDSLIPTPPTPAELTTGSGVVRNVTTFGEWQTARSAANPGDVINITAGITGVNENNAVLSWRGTHTQGTAANPIVITCSGGGYIQQLDQTTFRGTIDIVDCDHIHLIGADVRGGVFGPRFVRSQGTPAAPIKVWHNTVTGTSDACFQVSDGQSGSNYTAYVSVLYNDFGDSTGTTNFNEGVYVGTGAIAHYWQDRTHDIEIAYNKIHDVRGDGVDIKLGCYNIDVHHNQIHDVGAAWGSAVTTGATSSDPGTNPNMGTNPNITIHNNWIWNVGYRFSSPNATAYAINAGHAGTQVFNNVIWGLRSDRGPTGVRVVIYVDDASFPINVYNNTVWEDGGNALAYAVLGGSGPSVFFWDNLTGDGSRSSRIASSNDFVGPVPAFNSGPGSTNETADAGNGAGSGFFLAPSSTLVDDADGPTPSTDILGTVRPQGSGGDPGAYEYVP